MLDGLILFRKGDFRSKVCLWMVFKGGILDSAHQFWGNPYLLKIKHSKGNVKPVLLGYTLKSTFIVTK